MVKNKFFCEKGSLTVEATLAVTIYLLVIVVFIYWLEEYEIYAQLNSAMYISSYKLSDEIRLNKDINCDYIKNSVVEMLNYDYIENSCVNNGIDGIDMTDSVGVSKDENIIIKSRYSIAIPILNSKAMDISQQIVCRAFTGNIKEKSNKKFVYVTKTGEVYHTNVQCTYLVVKKQRVLIQEIDNYRNSSGGKYDICKECKMTENKKGYVYITSYGTSYHNEITCSTITRTIIPIEVSEIEGRKKCVKCAK